MPSWWKPRAGRWTNWPRPRWRSGHLLERRFRIRQQFGRDFRLRFHQFAALDVILDRIDAIERDDLAVLEIDDREAARRRIAAQDGGVMADGEAGGLQLEIVLVGPEPRQRVIRL